MARFEAVARLDELGDAVDGIIEPDEMEQLIATLSRPGRRD
jgi:hypothetical protein